MTAVATLARAPVDRWWSRAGIGLMLPVALLVLWEIIGRSAGGRRTPLGRMPVVIMCFSTRTLVPLISIPCRWATIPIVVTMQVPSAVAIRSVGENDSPLPMLSFGASVVRTVPEGPWMAEQWSVPS